MINQKNQGAEFSNINFGTTPTTSEFDIIHVTIDPDVMLGDYAKAYAKELYRRNPARYEASGLDEIALYNYFVGLLVIRIQAINGECKVWRQAKQLNIPSWIQFVISQIGVIRDVDRGLVITPVLEHPFDIDKMLETSDILRMFTADGVVMHRDAFPRAAEGDVDVMSMALINGYVKSMTKLAHPIASYVSAFIGAKVVEEATFKMLYRIRYDDVSFIREMLLHEEKVF